jgi:hypothetical protein
MTETKITKVKYVIQYKTDEMKDWVASDWNNGIRCKSDLENMLEILKRAELNAAECIKTLNIKPRYYRLVKQTHSITTEAIDENIEKPHL